MLKDLNHLDNNDPDYAAPKRECQRLQDEFLAETKQLYKPIHPSKQMRQNPNQQFEGSEDYDYVVDRNTGWKWYKDQQGNLPHTSSSSVLIMAEFIMAKLEFIVVALFKAWWWAVSDFFFDACCFGLPERRTDNSTGCVRRIHTRTVHHEHNSPSHKAQITHVLVAQGSSTNCSVHLCAHETSLSSGQPCDLLACLCLIFSLPVHHNTKHHLDSTTFSKTTPSTSSRTYTVRQAALTKPLSHDNYESGRKAAQHLSQGTTLTSKIGKKKSLRGWRSIRRWLHVEGWATGAMEAENKGTMVVRFLVGEENWWMNDEPSSLFAHHPSLGGLGWWEAMWIPLQTGEEWTVAGGLRTSLEEFELKEVEGRDLENEWQKKDRLKITGNNTGEFEKGQILPSSQFWPMSWVLSQSCEGHPCGIDRLM